jgi:hypothetical protein
MSSLFTGTADFCRQYRPGIPAEVADVLDRAADPLPADLRQALEAINATR